MQRTGIDHNLEPRHVLHQDTLRLRAPTNRITFSSSINEMWCTPIESEFVYRFKFHHSKITFHLSLATGFDIGNGNRFLCWRHFRCLSAKTNIIRARSLWAAVVPGEHLLLRHRREKRYRPVSKVKLRTENADPRGRHVSSIHNEPLPSIEPTSNVEIATACWFRPKACTGIAYLIFSW